MKRADKVFANWFYGTSILIIAALVAPSDSQAESARFTIIDARDGLTPDVLEAYSEAMGANAKTPLVKSRIKVLTTARHGFDVGAIELPEHVRHADLDVTLMVQQGASAPAAIDANHLSVTRRAPTKIKQTTRIQGH
ncbi:MAG: hypothetical protein ABJH52_01115 [Henriciella sp.]